jgi:hypothetical protein
MIMRKNLSKSSWNKKMIIILSIGLLLLGHFEDITVINASAENFTQNIRVDDLEPSTSYQIYPSIAIDYQGILHVVWEDWRNDADEMYVSLGGSDGLNNADIYYTNSTDNGMTFGSNIKVNINADSSQQGTPSIALDNNGTIHVVWSDYRNDADGFFVPSGGIDGANNLDIYYANSTDGGTTWNQGIRVNDDLGLANQGTGFRSIAVDKNDNIHIVWFDLRNNTQGDIYYANSTDGGLFFNENIKVNDAPNGSWDPSIAIDGNDNIYIVWTDNRNDTTKSDIFFSRSIDGGLSFSPNMKVNDDNLTSIEQRTPSIATGNGIIGIVWSDSRNSGYESIYYANSTDNGDSFNINRRVDDDYTAPFKARPVLAINDNKIGIAWADKRNGEYDIYFANSTDDGNSFSENQQVNDYESINKRQGFPSIAMNNYGRIYIVWSDGRNDNRDIYFSRSNFPPQLTTPISPPTNSTLTNTTPSLKVTTVTDPDNDTVYYNFTISDQPDAETGTVYYSGWITSTSWKPPPLSDGKWYWHTYTSDMWNTTTPNWVWNFTVDTNQAFGMWLHEGWNLISVPFIQMDTDLSRVLDSINGSYDAVQIYDISDNLDDWKHHQVSKSSVLNDMKDITHMNGFWIHVTEPGGVLFQCPGILPEVNQSISLKPGWNQVGYPSLTNKTRTEALNNLTFGTEIDTIWTYNASTQIWEKIGDTDYFERGRGYWIHAKTQCEWEIPL